MTASPPTTGRGRHKAAPLGPRLSWRAVVRGDRKPGDGHLEAGVSWHLASCPDPQNIESHCPEGQKLLAAQGDPDGHCLLDGRCPRCDAAAAAAEAAAALAATAAAAAAAAEEEAQALAAQAVKTPKLPETPRPPAAPSTPSTEAGSAD